MTRTMISEEIKKHIVRTYGIKPKKIGRVLGGVMNDNYKIASDKGDFIFRIYNRTPFETVHFEFDVLVHLSTKNFKSPQIRISLSGDGVILFKGKPSVLYTYIPGKPMKEVTKDLLQKIGEVMGKLHVSLSHFKPKIHKESWEPHFLQRLVEIGKNIFRHASIPRAQDLTDFLKVEMARFKFPDLPSGITHQDIKPENVLIHEGKVSGIIDFDNSFYGAYIHDLTTTAIWTCFTNHKLDREKLDALVRGYEKERPLTAVEHRVLEDALKWRLLREIFIGPYVTVKKTPKTVERLEYFKKLYTLFS